MLLRNRLPARHAVMLFFSLLATVVSAATVVDNRSLGDEADGSNWLAYGRTFSEQRFSPLDQINDRTIDRLKLAWSLDLDTFGHSQSSPLAVDGVLYFAVGYAWVHAVDARTGKLLWKYDPQTTKVAPQKLKMGWGIRGIAFWKGRVYTGTTDGRLLAIDAKTGKLAWSVQTVPLDDVRYITGAPRVFNGKVIIGHGGDDQSPIRGYVTAYDAETGKQVWRFWTVPGNPADGFESKAMAMAAKTWTGEWWKLGGGGAVWNGMTYDPSFNRIYIGTSNGFPWNQKLRSPGGGDNLFLYSIVALDADTGEYIWHYQTSPGESWDYNSNMDITLADVTMDGKLRKVLMHAPKNGFFYVIDRETGKLISAEKIGKVTWAEKIDLATGRPVEAPGIRYESGEILIWPGGSGVHNWYQQSYSPKTGLAYIPTHDVPGYYNDKGIDLAKWHPHPGTFTDNGVMYPDQDIPPEVGHSYLLAWNPVTQREGWKVETPGLFNGGTLATAGNLVFQGLVDGHLVAYAADSGKSLWRFNAHVAVAAPPISYSVGGKQYISVISGPPSSISSVVGSRSAQYGWQTRVHPRRLLTFVLDGKATLPPTPAPVHAVPIGEPPLEIDAVRMDRGRYYWQGRCQYCHGTAVISGGAAPDLRASAIPLSREAFSQVVREGTLVSRGMPRFDDIGEEELDVLRDYIRARATQSARTADKAPQ
jgi:quinohemoprotein ethanol dehydrogenase